MKEKETKVENTSKKARNIDRDNRNLFTYLWLNAWGSQQLTAYSVEL
jgi:hypothetical protein